MFHKPDAVAKLRANRASEPRDWSAPTKRRARARVGEFEGRSPSTHRRAMIDAHATDASRFCGLRRHSASKYN